MHPALPMHPALLAAPFERFLDQQFAGNPVRAWLHALIAFVVTVLVLGLTKRLVQYRLAKIAETTATDLDDLVVDLVRRTSRFFRLALGVYFAHHWLSLDDRPQYYVEIAVKLACWIQVGLWGIGLVEYGIQRMVRGRPADDPARTMGTSVLGFIAQVLVWGIVFLSFLQAIGTQIGPILASLGVGGIAVALALQNILGDLFASITILLDKPFVVGDSILIGDFNGTIEKIGVKTSRLRSVSGEEIIIGNNDLVSSRVRNFKRMRERRQVFALRLPHPSARLARSREPARSARAVGDRTHHKL